MTINVTEFYRNLDELLDLAPGTIKPGDLLVGLEGWDSLAVIGFIAMADEKYGATANARAISACLSVDDLAAVIVANEESLAK